MKILVVDANQAFRESVANLLLICGVDQFEIVSSAEDALEKISNSFFDIILMDLFITYMNCLDLPSQFHKRLPKSKIIALVEDEQWPLLTSLNCPKLDLPIILKSYVSRDLPQFLSGKSDLRPFKNENQPDFN